MADAIDIKLLDLRTVETYIRRDVITQAQYDEWLQSLPDDAEQGEDTDTVMEANALNRADDNGAGEGA